MVAMFKRPTSEVEHQSGAEMLITPEQAQHWIDTCAYDKQRTVRDWEVAYLADAIAGGDFAQTPITFAYCRKTNHTYLVDGQHRLRACVKADTPVTLDVLHRTVDTLDDIASLYARLDRGIGRSMADVLKVHDVAGTLGLPAGWVNRVSASVVLIDRKFMLMSKADSITRSGDMRVASLRAWGEELRAYYQCLGSRNSSDMRRMLAAPVSGVALVTLRHVEAAPLFWSAVAENDGLHKGTPERTLADYITNAPPLRRGQPRVARGVATCWNAAYRGKPLSIVKVHDDHAPIEIAGTPFNGRR